MTSTVQKISAKKAKMMMEENALFVLLDVRTEAEYKERRIPGATLIPVDQLAARSKTDLPDKDALIFLYCQSGQRSAFAADILVKSGYAQVYNFGGIMSWPFDTISG